ncbi:MAG: histidinol-phosphate transaminase [Clostridiales bacterium]|nr:histidinol-phosphate transaminase [Clostridiales bacterium]
MSRFLIPERESLVPYVPGEQPKERKYVKLNTNESPFPPSPTAIAEGEKELALLQLYPDPECARLREAVAKRYGVKEDQVIMTNGSDEVLQFAFAAFCNQSTPAVFPDITYGFYKVFADLYNLPKTVLPLKEDFTVDLPALTNAKGTLFIANPNAPTGIPLTKKEIEGVLKANPNRVVVVDEAYVDFGAESVVDLIDTYDNLLVTQTFSKSRSMAGARLGMGFANAGLIADLNRIRYSVNPYNVNRVTMAAGMGSIKDEGYFQNNCKEIISLREETSQALQKMGFTLTPSKANFLFAKHERVGGEEIYLKLKEKGVLVRHFTGERIKEYNRITVGSAEEMQALLTALKEIV